MKFIHTSDWHIGRTLYGRKRYDEFSGFLDWLATFIESQNADTLLVAGDIFDTGMPSHRAQEIYYRFLCRISVSCCRHVVIIAGNHDSPSFLNAPKELLKTLNVHVIGAASAENLEDEIIVLKNPSGMPEAIVLAVPYLRDRDIRMAEAGESLDDKHARLIQGIRAHYAEVSSLAEKKLDHWGQIPIIAMGHLFAAGGRTVEGDGVRELYVGSAVHVGKDIFSSQTDYVALGHLHVSQTVGGKEHIRYSGSPIPMGFGEAGQKKKVIVGEFGAKSHLGITEHVIPVFQILEKIAGNMDDILERLIALKAIKSRAWLEIDVRESKGMPDERRTLEDAVADSDMEILRIRNQRATDLFLSQQKAEAEALSGLNPEDVFIRLLDACEMEEERRPDLIRTYREALTLFYERDSHAE